MEKELYEMFQKNYELRISCFLFFICKTERYEATRYKVRIYPNIYNTNIFFYYKLIVKICFYLNSIQETDWSIQIADAIVTNEWKCPNCDNVFFITGIQKLQHKNGMY